LTEDQRQDSHVGRVSHVPKQAADNQVSRWEDRGRRAETLERETGEGVQKHWKTCCNQQHSQDPKRGYSQQRCSYMPFADPPRHVACDDPWSDDKEDRRTKNGECSPQSIRRGDHAPRFVRSSRLFLFLNGDFIANCAQLAQISASGFRIRCFDRDLHTWRQRIHVLDVSRSHPKLFV